MAKLVFWFSNGRQRDKIDNAAFEGGLKMPRGGKREGAGRPPKEGELRKMCSMRATREEWELIQQFARILKYGDKDKAKKFVEENS